MILLSDMIGNNNKKNLSFVSIVIPCMNEGDFIEDCLESIVNNDYPKDNLEVKVVDGMSEDGTRDIVKKFTTKYPYIVLLNNPQKIIPTAMNIGIINSMGEIIMKIDAHSIYEKDYISRCVKYLNEWDADNVGGIAVTKPRNNNYIGRAIVIALSHRFGVGSSYFRIGVDKPMWADTAYSGCYRRDVFDRIGLYDENIARSEDIYVNSRILKSGGKILLVPDIKVFYYARSKITEFIRHNFDNGFWTAYPLAFGRIIFSWRHMIPFFFVSTLFFFFVMAFVATGFYKTASLWLLVLEMGAYILLNIYYSYRIASSENNYKQLFIMPFIFSMLHIGYGIGSVFGLLKIPMAVVHSIIVKVLKQRC